MKKWLLEKLDDGTIPTIDTGEMYAWIKMFIIAGFVGWTIGSISNIENNTKEILQKLK